MVTRLSKHETPNLLHNIDTILFDCDGVLWNSYGSISGAVKVIEKLHELKKRVFFVTNNSTKSRHDLSKNFKKHGFIVDDSELLGTAYLAAMYLKNIVKLEKKVYMVGSPGMAEEFNDAGIQYIGLGPQPPGNDPNIHYALNFDVKKVPDVQAVVVGYDTHFNLNKISQAMQYLQDKSIPFIATNTDNSYPVGNGVFTPGTGCVVKAIEHAVSREPIVIGKPNPLMFDIVKDMYDLKPSRTLMVGDRLDTDIMFGKNCKLVTLCVLSGITSAKQIEALPVNSDLRPDFLADSVQDLLDLM